MRTLSRLAAAALLLAASAMLASCTNDTGKTTEPSATLAPQVAYSTVHYIKYWPEDADYASCDYSCVVELPEFSNTYTAGYAMNKAVSEYLEGLGERISSDYLPHSEFEKPHTEVVCEVEYLPGCTNVIFTEEHAYSAEKYTRTHVLMLDEYGNELNLCDIFLNYHCEQLVSELVAERVGCEPTKALAAIDINHGAKATLAGCTLYARAGMLAGIGEGELRFDISYDDIAPDFVGVNGLISHREYRSLTEFLRFVSDAAVVRQENIEGGALSAFEASSFMGEFVRTLGLSPDAGRLRLSQGEFEDYYSRFFGKAFPGIDSDGHDIKLENGYYSVLNTAKPYEYNVDMLGLSEDGSVLTLTGDLIFGNFGYAFSSYVCHVTVVLERNAESPCGFRLVDYIMSV